MAIGLDATRIATQTATVSTQDNTPVAQGAKTSPILGGESLKVSSGAMTDLEKLVAQLKNESENSRQNVAHRRISILHTVLDSMADRISEAEKKNLIEIEGLNLQKTNARTELDGYISAKASTDGRISLLDTQIQALEKAIEQAVKDGEDHRKQVEELKAKRDEERKELDRLDNMIASTSAKISGIDVKMAECSAAIASTTLNEVASALRHASNDGSLPPERPEREAERAKEEKKVESADLANIISDALDKIDDQIRRTLDEAQVVKA